MESFDCPQLAAQLELYGTCYYTLSDDRLNYIPIVYLTLQTFQTVWSLKPACENHQSFRIQTEFLV